MFKAKGILQMIQHPSSNYKEFHELHELNE